MRAENRQGSSLPVTVTVTVVSPARPALVEGRPEGGGDLWTSFFLLPVSGSHPRGGFLVSFSSRVSCLVSCLVLPCLECFTSFLARPMSKRTSMASAFFGETDGTPYVLRTGRDDSEEGERWCRPPISILS